MVEVGLAFIDIGSISGRYSPAFVLNVNTVRSARKRIDPGGWVMVGTPTSDVGRNGMHGAREG